MQPARLHQSASHHRWRPASQPAGAASAAGRPQRSLARAPPRGALHLNVTLPCRSKGTPVMISNCALKAATPSQLGSMRRLCFTPLQAAAGSSRQASARCTVAGRQRLSRQDGGWRCVPAPPSMMAVSAARACSGWRRAAGCAPAPARPAAAAPGRRASREGLHGRNGSRSPRCGRSGRYACVCQQAASSCGAPCASRRPPPAAAAPRTSCPP